MTTMNYGWPLAMIMLASCDAGCTCGGSPAPEPLSSVEPPTSIAPIPPATTTTTTPDAPSADTMDGVPVRLRDGGFFVQTMDRARLEHAMQVGFAAWDDFSGAYVDPDQTTITTLAEQPTDGGRPVIAYGITSTTEGGSETHAALALPSGDGWFLFEVSAGGTRGADSVDTSSRVINSAAFSTVGPYLRLDASGRVEIDAAGLDPGEVPEGAGDATCTLTSRDQHDFVDTAICRTGASPRCFVVEEATSSAHYTSSRFTCVDAEGEVVGGAWETLPRAHVPAASTTITVDEGGLLHVVREPPSADGAARAPGTFDSLCASESPMGHTDREHAAMVSASGGEDAEDGDAAEARDVLMPGRLTPEAIDALEHGSTAH